MTARRPPLLAVLLGLALAVVLAGSCGPQSEDECYESLPRPQIDATQDPTALPYCVWTSSTLPDPPEGYAFTHRVSASFVPSENEPCDPCDVERLDALLRAAIDEQTSQGSPSCARVQPSEPMRACVHPPDERSDECTVMGVFFSNYHDVPVEHGCTDCRADGSCPGS